MIDGISEYDLNEVLKSTLPDWEFRQNLIEKLKITPNEFFVNYSYLSREFVYSDQEFLRQLIINN